MLRTETPLRPTVAGVEFNPQEVTDFAKYAVFDPAHQFPAGIRDPDRGAQRNRALHLDARSGKRNIFQVGNTLGGCGCSGLSTGCPPDPRTSIRGSIRLSSIFSTVLIGLRKQIR